MKYFVQTMSYSSSLEIGISSLVNVIFYLIDISVKFQKLHLLFRIASLLTKSLQVEITQKLSPRG